MEKHVHSMRIGALEWNGDTIFSGSRDKTVRMMDIRSPFSADQILQYHKQEASRAQNSVLQLYIEN